MTNQPIPPDEVGTDRVLILFAVVEAAIEAILTRNNLKDAHVQTLRGACRFFAEEIMKS
jgi:hypothetical protein